MKVYFTTERTAKLKDIIVNIENFYIIDVSEIISQVSDLNTPYAKYYINNVIINAFKEAYSKKKYSGVIYINKIIDKNILDNIKEMSVFENLLNNYILLDNSVLPKHKEIYKWFEEITFYTRLKKIKI